MHTHTLPRDVALLPHTMLEADHRGTDHFPGVNLTFVNTGPVPLPLGPTFFTVLRSARPRVTA